MGRGDHADVDAPLLRRADRAQRACLEHAQQLRLQRERHLADLVEQQRAAIGRGEQAGVIVGRAGERALDVAEQLALEQLLGQRRAVERDERLLRARARAVDRARDRALAGAGLAGDQHGHARRATRSTIPSTRCIAALCATRPWSAKRARAGGACSRPRGAARAPRARACTKIASSSSLNGLVR